jgi:hypothetical protein
VKTGELDRGAGAVVFQGYNTLLRGVEIGRRVRDQEELEARLQILEQALESAADEARREGPWGA